MFRTHYPSGTLRKKCPLLAGESILNPDKDLGTGPQRHSLEFVPQNNEIIFKIVQTKGNTNYSHTISYPDEQQEQK